jgi:predicted nicotinamide N-methyase
MSKSIKIMFTDHKTLRNASFDIILGVDIPFDEKVATLTMLWDQSDDIYLPLSGS